MFDESGMISTVPPEEEKSNNVFVKPFVGSTNPFAIIKSNEDRV